MRNRARLVVVVLLLSLLSLPYFLTDAHADTVQKISVGDKPINPVLDTSNGNVYVESATTDTVWLLNGSSVAATISMVYTTPQGGQGPITDLKDPVFDPANNYLYVPDSNGNYVGMTVLSGTSIAGYPHISVGETGATPAYDPSNGYVYDPDGRDQQTRCVANCDASDAVEQVTYYGVIAVISGTTSVANITVGYTPGSPYYNTTSDDPDVGATYDAANGYVYIPNNNQSDVYVVAGTSVIATVGVGNTPERGEVDPTNGYVYIANAGSNTISVLDGTTVIDTIPLSGAPDGVIYDPADGYLYAGGVNNVWVISGTSVVATLGAGESGGAAYDSDNGYLYFTNGLNSTIYAVSGTSIVYSDAVGGIPEGMVYDPANGYLYAADRSNGVIDVINPEAGLVGASSCSSSSSSVAKSSSTTKSTSATTSCCATQSQTSSTTASKTSSSCTTAVVVSSATSSSPSASGTSSTATLSSSTATSTSAPSNSSAAVPPPTGPGGIPIGTLEIVGGAIGGAGVVGGAIYFYTQGGGGGGGSDDSPGGESGSSCGPYSNPGCGPAPPGCSAAEQGPPGENCPDLVGHATRSSPVTSGCFATTSGLTVNTSGCQLTGHATHGSPTQPSSGCFATAQGPSVGRCQLSGHADPAPPTQVSCSIAQVQKCQPTGHASRPVSSPSGCVPVESGPSVGNAYAPGSARVCAVPPCSAAVAGGSVSGAQNVPAGHATISSSPCSQTVTGASLNCTAGVRSAPLKSNSPSSSSGQTSDSGSQSNESGCSSTAEDTPSCGT